MRAEVDVAIATGTNVAAADQIAAELERVLVDHIPALAGAHVRVRPEGAIADSPSQSHHHAPDSVQVDTELAAGLLEIIDTPQGERMQLRVSRATPGLSAAVIISRVGGDETLELSADTADPSLLISAVAPAEPHEFDAVLSLSAGDTEEAIRFRIVEPAGHAH